MIVYFDKRTGEILGSEELSFVDEGYSMRRSSIPARHIGKVLIGGEAELDDEQEPTGHIKKDGLWDVVRDIEDTHGESTIFDYTLPIKSDDE